MSTEYNARLQELGETHEDFEGHEIGKLIVEAGERLAALCLQEEAIDEAMTVLHRAFDLPELPSDHRGDRSWRALWAETPRTDVATLPLAQLLTRLNGYAFYGLSPAADRECCDVEEVESVVSTVRKAVARTQAELSTLPDAERTLLAAEARLALDLGRDLLAEQLAALTRIGMKSMRNALAPSSGSGLEAKDGKISRESALAWLTGRGDFRSSIWYRSHSDTAEEPVSSVQGPLLWVPFAKDESLFHPRKCRRAGKYTIGPKGAERAFDNYQEALDHLARMRPAAYWRRPNNAGNWVIVTAVGFRPCTGEELGLPLRP